MRFFLFQAALTILVEADVLSVEEREKKSGA